MSKARRQQAGRQQPAQEKKPEKPKSAARSLTETVVILVVLVLFLRGCLLESFRIPSSSMEPALIGNPYYGDRVLAWKPSIRFGTPRRWSIDVFVKRPDPLERMRGEHTDRNFIKRMIGLPEERLIIAGGDIFVESPDDPVARIARKPPDVQSAVWHPAYEGAEGWLPNWSPSGSLRQDESSRRLVSDGSDCATARFVLNHYRDDQGLITNLYLRSSRARVFCPHCGSSSKISFRTSRTRVRCPNAACRLMLDVLEDDLFSASGQRVTCPTCSVTLPDASGLEQCPACGAPIDAGIMRASAVRGRYPQFRDQEEAVSDIRVSLDVTPLTAAGAVTLEIVVDQDRCRARVELDGRRVQIAGPHGVQATGEAPRIAEGAPFRFSLAHVDHAVEVRVDGACVARKEYERDWRAQAGRPRGNSVRVGVDHAAVALGRPMIERDLHYLSRGSAEYLEFYDARRGSFETHPGRQLGGAPPGTGEADAVRTRRFSETEYFMMGDNSPSSYDSRMWGPIRKGDLVGCAFFLFWPPSRIRVVD